MCGFAAIYNFSGRPVDHSELLRCRDRMLPRGPDGEGSWVSEDGYVGLAHRRLSIIDLSDAGTQPMISASGRHVIVFNGEIYNYRDLRDELEREGVSFRSSSDTEVLLQLYERHGKAMLTRLRGMFALAIWDGDRRSLFLARDPYGIKPLYIAPTADGVRVASQVRALLECEGIDRTPDPAGHCGFFMWGYVPEPHTFFRGISAVPAGHYLEVTQAGISEVVPFASLTSLYQKAESEAHESEAQRLNGSAREFVREQLVDSLRHHFIADVDVGLFLSSGRDSATLAALAAEDGKTLRTLTLGFDEYRGTEEDEVPLAEELARHCGADHTTIRVSRSDFLGEVDRLFGAMDQPTTDGVNSYFVSMAARRSGLKVALSGLGGDELFGGYPSFTEVPRFARMVPSLGRAGAAIRIVTAPVLSRITSPKYAGVFEYGGSYEGGYLLRRGYFMPWELTEVLDPDMVKEGLESLRTLPRLRESYEGIEGSHLRVSALESSWYMRSQLLRDTDWASMAHSLEVRVPLVDWHLTSALAPLAGAGAPVTKDMMASAPTRPLPDAIRNRPKTGFMTPTRQWLTEGIDPKYAQRGLRGWAQYVYNRYMEET